MNLKPRTTNLNPKALLYRRFNQLETSYGNVLFYTDDQILWFFDAESATFINTNKTIQDIENGHTIYEVTNEDIFSFKNSYYGYYNGSWSILNPSTYFVWDTTILYKVLMVFPSTYRYFKYSVVNGKPKMTEVEYDSTLTSMELSKNELYKLNPTLSTDCLIFKPVKYIGDEPDYQWAIVHWASYDLNLLSTSFSNIGKVQTNKYYYCGAFDYVVKGSLEGETVQYIKGNVNPITSMTISYYDDYINIKTDDLIVIDNHLYTVTNVIQDPKWRIKKYNIYSCTLTSLI